MKKRYKVLSARAAARKGLLRKGTKFMVEFIAISHSAEGVYCESSTSGKRLVFNTSKIRIPIPESKPIDFGVAGRVLKHANGDIVKTTGYCTSLFFSAYVLESQKHPIGFCLNDWFIVNDWQDITDTYKS